MNGTLMQIAQITEGNLRHVIAGVACAASVAIFTLAQERDYTTVVSFTPVGGDTRVGRIASLAAQFGIDAAQARAVQSPELFAELVRSEWMQAQLAKRRLTIGGQGKGMSLVELQYGTDANAKDSIEVRDFLKKSIDVGVGQKTGLIRISVTTSEVELSDAVASALIDLIQEYIQRSKQVSAIADSTFFASRLLVAQNELMDFQKELGEFLSKNRGGREVPALKFVEERLRQRVQLQEDVISGLIQNREQARIEAVRSVPSISFAEQPFSPRRPKARGTIVKTLLSFVIGILASVGFTLFLVELDSNRKSSLGDS